MTHSNRVRKALRAGTRFGPRQTRCLGWQPSDLGFRWGATSGTIKLDVAPKLPTRNPWDVNLMRQAIEGTAASEGIAVDELFRSRLAYVSAIVERLRLTSELTTVDCEKVAELLLIVTCRDPALPDAGRHHALRLLAAVLLRQLRHPRAPSSAVIARATLTALSALASAGVVALCGCTPHQIILDGEPVGDALRITERDLPAPARSS